MLKNYFRIAFRNLARNKSTSFINIGGLALGMAVAMLIGLWVYDELSFDKYHRHYDRVAQVMQNQDFNGQVETWSAETLQLGLELRNHYGNNFKQVVMSSWISDHLITLGEKKINQEGNYMEPGAPELLSLQMLRGSRQGLADPGSILLAVSAAKAIFGDEDPMNKILTIDNKQHVKVTGVYEDLPENTTFSRMAFLAPWALMVQSEGLEKRVGWGNSWFQAFVRVADHVDMNKASATIRDAKWKNVVHTEAERFNPRLFLQPMSRWHLYGEFRYGVNVGGKDPVRLVIRHYRCLCPAPGLHQFYEPQYGPFRKKGQRSGYPQGHRLHARATDRAVLQRIHPGGLPGICLVHGTGAAVAAFLQ